MLRTKKETTIFWVLDCPENPRLHSIIFCIAAVLFVDFQLFMQVDFKKLAAHAADTQHLQLNTIIPLILLLIGYYLKKKHALRRDMDMIREVNEEKGIERSDEHSEQFIREFNYTTKIGLLFNFMMIVEYMFMYMALQFITVYAMTMLF